MSLIFARILKPTKSVNYSVEANDDPQMDFADGASDEIDCHNCTIFYSRRTDRSDAKHEIKISEAHSEDPDEIEAVNNLIHRSFEDSSSFEDCIINSKTNNRNIHGA